MSIPESNEITDADILFLEENLVKANENTLSILPYYHAEKLLRIAKKLKKLQERKFTE